MAQTHNTWNVLPCQVPQTLRAWLTNTGSLTARLIAHFQHFHVDVLHSHLAPVHQDESFPIQVKSHQLVYTRDVLLCSQTLPLVYAHSVTHPRWLKHPLSWLKHQGNQSLGTAIFNNTLIERGTINMTKLKAYHPLYRKIQIAVDFHAPYLWARRSIFYYQKATLLVTEVFLPPFVERV